MSSNRKWEDIRIANNHRLGTKAGYSLLELLAAVAISGIVLAAITTSFMSQSRSYDVQEQVNEMQQNVRAAMDLISREVRLAGYLMPNTAVAIPYNTLQLEVRANLNGDRDTSGGDENERIIYSYDAVNLRIERNPGGFGGGNEVLAENIGGFDSNGNPIPGFTFAYLDSNGIARNLSISSPDVIAYVLLTGDVRYRILSSTSPPRMKKCSPSVRKLHQARPIGSFRGFFSA